MDAAALYGEAASLSNHLTLHSAHLAFCAGRDFYAQGTEFGDNAALTEAITAYQRCLTLSPRPERPLDWAMTQVGLGNTLKQLAERESGTDKLKAAVAAYRQAMKEFTREHVPFQWAATRVGLGIRFRSSGSRERHRQARRSRCRLSRSAKGIYPRTRPLDWATTQNNLGGALFRLGRRESGTDKLEEAVAPIAEAMKEWTRERVRSIGR